MPFDWQAEFSLPAATPYKAAPSPMALTSTAAVLAPQPPPCSSQDLVASHSSNVAMPQPTIRGDRLSAMPFDWQAELTASASLSLMPAHNASTSVTAAQLITAPPKSFAAAVGGFRSSPAEEAPYPVSCIKGDSLVIRIGQDEYVKGLAECQFALRGRLTLSKGDKPYTARDLASKLGKVWKMIHH